MSLCDEHEFRAFGRGRCDAMGVPLMDIIVIFSCTSKVHKQWTIIIRISIKKTKISSHVGAQYLAVE